MEETEIIDLSRPQKHFTYPRFAALPSSSAHPLEDLQFAIAPATPKAVHIEGNTLKAMTALFNEIGIQKFDRVGVQLPAPPEFLRVARERAQVVILPRDPEELLAMDFSPLRLVLFSHPSAADGFYYPSDIYDRILQKALLNPRTIVFSDESHLFFTFNSVVPGSARSFLPTGRVYIGGSLYPIMCPQGPYLSWWYGQAPNKIPNVVLDVADLELAQEAVLSFRSRHGRALQEFQRKILVLQVSLRELTDLLKPALVRRDIQVPFWPETGFNLLVDISPFLQRSGLDMESYRSYLLEKKGLRIESGEAYGCPQTLVFCFAAKPAILKRLTAGFLKSLTEFRV